MHGTFTGSWHAPGHCLWQPGDHRTLPARLSCNAGVPCTTPTLLVRYGLTRETQLAWAWFSYIAWTSQGPLPQRQCLGRQGRWWRFRRPPAPRRGGSRCRSRSRRCGQGRTGALFKYICRLCDGLWIEMLQSMCPLHVLLLMHRIVRWHFLLCCILCCTLYVGAQSGTACRALEIGQRRGDMSTGHRASEDEAELLSELVSEGPSPELDPDAPPAGPPPPRPEPQHQFSVEVSHAVASVLLRYVDWTGRVLTRVRGRIEEATGITIEVRAMAWHEEVHRDITFVRADPLEGEEPTAADGTSMESVVIEPARVERLANTFLVHTGDAGSLGTAPTSSSSSGRRSGRDTEPDVKAKARPIRKHRPQLLSVIARACISVWLGSQLKPCCALGEDMMSVSRGIQLHRVSFLSVQSLRQQSKPRGRGCLQCLHRRSRWHAGRVEKTGAVQCSPLRLVLYYCITWGMTRVARYSFTRSFRTTVCTLLAYVFSGLSWCT